MQKANVMGALRAGGTLHGDGDSKRARRASRQSEGQDRKAWLLALLASACGSGEGDPAASRAEQELSMGDVSAERMASEGAYTLFEADPVRPIAVLEKSGLVAVTNTVDGYLEILRPTRRSAAPCGAVQVGLQPVSVAVVDEGESSAELWVVNHLSNSVSVITLDMDDCRAKVTRTLQVGDEPRDIVVARDSSDRARVFVATAHRGQNHPLESARLGTDLVSAPSEKSAPGLADVLVFDPAAPDAAPAVVNLFGDRPRALAAADSFAYVASFLSGNRTTVIRVDDLSVADSFAGVGTVLFGLAVQPGTGKVFVTHTDANNLTRFEGHGKSSSSTLIGHLHESRITVLDPARAAGAPAVQPRDIFLNDAVASPSGPVGLALDARRGRLYVKTHFDNQLVVIDTDRERVTGRVFLHDAEPESVSRGRSVPYNARLTSSHGDSACATATCSAISTASRGTWAIPMPPR